jgi:Spy/CpxP family protein refolding chaperone
VKRDPVDFVAPLVAGSLVGLAAVLTFLPIALAIGEVAGRVLAPRSTENARRGNDHTCSAERNVSIDRQPPIRGSKGDFDMKRSVAAVVVALLSAASLAAQPAGHRSGPPVGFGPMDAARGGLSSACIEALGLTDAQQASLADLRRGLATTVQPLLGERRGYHDQIDTALEADSPDPAAIGRLVIADHGIKGQIRAAHDQFVARFRELLSPEQVTNYMALRGNGVCAPPRKGPH